MEKLPLKSMKVEYFFTKRYSPHVPINAFEGIQYYFNDLNTDGLFTLADSNTTNMFLWRNKKKSIFFLIPLLFRALLQYVNS